jgi:hypothetical protein
MTRAQRAHGELFNGLQPGMWAELERAFETSGKFEVVYSNPDARVFRLK